MAPSVRAILYAGIMAAAGYCLAEFYPLFSDPLTQRLCEPFSPCRNSAAVGYVVGGAILGVVLGLLSAVLQAKPGKT